VTDQEAGWIEQDVPDQSGRTIVVTGANSGLGLETSRVLAEGGARVIMACRRIEDGRRVAAAPSFRSAQEPPEIMELDLARLETIRRFAAQIERHRKIDVLVNNAGVMAIANQRTKDGFEGQFGINHLGHFALTGLLLPQLLAGEGGRVVTVSSDMHRMGRIHFDDLHSEHRYRRWSSYGQSKLANLYFAYELARQAGAADAPLRSMAAHPGYAATNLQFQAARERGKTGRFWRLSQIFAQSAARGALPQLRAATDPKARSGSYYGPRRSTGGPAVVVESSSRSHDEGAASRLWDISSELTGVTFDF
jgi:NAD(P)-dependent dehydrogenase (short-subunit alcohol dehydrogenase family)